MKKVLIVNYDRNILQKKQENINNLEKMSCGNLQNPI